MLTRAVGAAGAEKAADGAAETQAIRKAARGFEAMLLRELMSAMEKAQLEEGGFFGASSGFAAHQTTMELYLTEALAEREPLGLADDIARQLSRTDSFDLSRGGAQVSAAAAEKTLGAACIAGLALGKTPEDGRHEDP